MGKHDGCCFGCGCHQIYLKFDNMRQDHRWRFCGRLLFGPWPQSLADISSPFHTPFPNPGSSVNHVGDSLFIYTLLAGFNLVFAYFPKTSGLL